MNPAYEIYELFDCYLKQKLSGSERLNFEGLLANDPAFREEYDAYMAVHEVFIGREMIDLKARIANDLKNYGKSNWWRKGWLGAVLSVAVLGTAAFFLLNDVSDPEPVHPQEEVSKETGITEQEKAAEEQKAPDEHPSIQNKMPQSEVLKAMEEKKQSATTSAQPRQKEWDMTGSAKNKVAGQEQKIQPVKEDKILPEKAGASVSNAPEADKALDICADITFKVPVNTKASAYDAATGKILIDMDNIQGGSAPYRFLIKGHSDKFSSGNACYNLAPGSYTVVVQDKNGCEQKLPEMVIIKKTSCLVNYQQTFNPQTEFKWAIPVVHEKQENAKITLIDKRGITIYSATIEPGINPVWDGKTNEGEEVFPGLYNFKLEYADGEICLGSLTVFR